MSTFSKDTFFIKTSSNRFVVRMNVIMMIYSNSLIYKYVHKKNFNENNNWREYDAFKVNCIFYKKEFRIVEGTNK